MKSKGSLVPRNAIEYLSAVTGFSKYEVPSKLSLLTPSIKSEISELEKVISLKKEENIFAEPISYDEIFIPVQEEVSKAEEYKKLCNKYCVAPVGNIIKTLENEQDSLDLACYSANEVNMYFINKALVDPPTTPLKYLNLSNNFFGKDACVTLSNFIQQSIISEVNLSNCRIGPEGAELIAEAIEVSQDLIKLNLSRCNICDTGGIAVANALKLNEMLKDIDLSHNKLHTGAALEFGKMLSTNETLESINFSWNDFYPELKGSVTLVAGLIKNNSLKEINLSWNGLTGVKFSGKLAGCLRKNKTLKKLNLENNILNPTDLGIIISGLKKSQSLEEIYLGGNVFTDDIIKLIFTGDSSFKILSFGKNYYMNDEIYNLMKKFQFKKPGVQFIFKGKILPNPPDDIDFKMIALDRCKFLAMKPKKKSMRRDMGHFMITLMEREEDVLKPADFQEILLRFKAKLDEDLQSYLTETFTVKIGDGKKKKKMVDIKNMATIYLERYPTERPPPVVAKRKKEIKKKK